MAKRATVGLTTVGTMHAEKFVSIGLLLLDASPIGGVPIPSGCRRGKCGLCLVKILSGAEHISPMTDVESLTLRRIVHEVRNMRLACQCKVMGKIIIEINL